MPRGAIKIVIVTRHLEKRNEDDLGQRSPRGENQDLKGRGRLEEEITTLRESEGIEEGTGPRRKIALKRDKLLRAKGSRREPWPRGRT